ncbi:MAG: PEGA domain-containing protein, partial [Myxococcales bacterium]|nr:PEGA domain-containing protein [Myxococcales bacterium]
PAASPTPTAASAEPTEAERKRARDSYADGQAHFAEGRYAEALDAFTRAHANVRNPIVRISIGECLMRLARFEEAHEAFGLYLQERPDASDRASVEAKLAEIAAMTGTLAVASTPAGAKVIINGQDTGQVTPAELALTRGDHTLELRLEGHEPLSEELSIRVGAREEIAAQLEAAAPPPPPPPAATEDTDGPVEPAEPPTTALWVTSVVGAAGLVGGTVLGFMALAERSDFDANPTEASADRGERLALFADVSFGIGAMAIITGAVLYLTVDESGERAPEGEDPEAADQARLEVAPLVGPDAAGVITRITF